MTEVLRIENLYKSFGDNRVIDGLSLSVPEGSIFGFIGQNGAGKTTTMKMVLGLLKPDSGDIYVCGEKVRFGLSSANRLAGYLPDVPEFYSYMRPREYLRLCGKICGLSDSIIKTRVDTLLELVGLSRSNKKIGGFSRGMKQRLGVAQALINEPKLLICDEPTSALDPMGRRDILDILKQIRSATTVVFSTHILSDVEQICDRAAALHGGKIVFDSTLAELKTRHKTDAISIEFSSVSDKHLFLNALTTGYKEFDADAYDLTRSDQTGANLDGVSEHELTLNARDLPALHRVALQVLAQHNILPIRMEVLAPTIENLFLEAVR